MKENELTKVFDGMEVEIIQGENGELLFELYFNTFDNFKILHNKEILRITSSNNKIISSMGI